MKKICTLIIATLLLAGCSFLADTHKTHYHANWALFINGQRVDFTSDKYMEPLISCELDETQINPEERTHMHENNQDVVHIHAAGVTWNHFLNNIGWNVGDNYLITDKGTILRENGTNKLTFIINGESVPYIQNTRIENEEQLLISYGTESKEEILKTQFTQVEDTAHEHNEHDDPSTCSSN